MPHRPERSGVSASNSANSSHSSHSSHSSTGMSKNTGAVYARINGFSEEAAAHIMRPMYSQLPHTHAHAHAHAHSHSSQPAGIVTPMAASKPWFTSPHPGPRGMMPSLEKRKSSDSTDNDLDNENDIDNDTDNRSVATSSRHNDDTSTVATLATEPSADELERRENIASALLLVSAAAVRHDADSDRMAHKEEHPQSSLPHKKRKKHLDFLRKNSNEESTKTPVPIYQNHDAHQNHHNSPMHRHASVEGRTVSHEESTPQRRVQSYDSKDESPLPKTNKEAAMELLDSAKIHNSKDISLPSQVFIPHFPSTLHKVLSDPQISGNVLTWLPDGESWKVLRWDGLRREVLPRYFSNLRDENGIGSGTIDAFLWHLSAWGFEEVKDGSAVGAYRHELFIRGAQKLSNKMHYTPSPKENIPKTVSPMRSKDEDRSMLQVPILNGTTGELHIQKQKRPRYEDAQSSAMPSMRRSPLSWMNGGCHPQAQHRVEEPWRHQYPHPHHSHQYYGADPAARVYSNEATMYNDPRYVSHAQPFSHAPPMEYITPPPQVRSARGAMRIASRLSTSSPANAPSAQAVPTSKRCSFPVSNRGKGRKSVASSRSTSPSVQSNNTIGASTSKSATSLEEEAQRVGKGVAIAISRKTKRKLPMARKVGSKDNNKAVTATL